MNRKSIHEHVVALGRMKTEAQTAARKANMAKALATRRANLKARKDAQNA